MAITLDGPASATTRARPRARRRRGRELNWRRMAALTVNVLAWLLILLALQHLTARR